MEVTLNSGVSNVLNNHHLSELQYENMKLIGPIPFNSDEFEFAGRVNAAYPSGTIELLAASYCIPPHLTGGRALVAENYLALDEGKCMTFSTDVGDLSWKTPLSLLLSACFPTSSSLHTWGATAAAGTSIGHKGMMHAAKIMALSAIDLYADPERLRPIRSEFEAMLKAHPYHSPIPDDLQPPRFHNPERNVD
jgi:aminobenzoyl-glutamate utilization protein B